MTDLELETLRAQRARQLQAALTNKKKEPMMTHPQPITDATFTEFVNEHPIAVVDFWAEWCGPCRTIAPAIDELAADYAGKIAFGKLNVDENRGTAGNLGIMSIPTLVVYKGGKEAGRIVGAGSKEHLQRQLQPYVS